MLFSLLALAQIRHKKPESDSKREVLGENEDFYVSNCDKITEPSAKEVTFTPSSNFYCFTTEFNFYIDGSSTVYEYDSDTQYKDKKYTDCLYIAARSNRIYVMNHTFKTGEKSSTINIFFESTEISQIPDSLHNSNKNKYIINNNFDDIIYSRYQYNSAGELDTSSSNTNIDYVVVLGKKGMNVKVSSNAEIKPIGTTSASIKDGYTLQKPELLIFNIEPPEDKQVANEIVDIKMKVTITGHTSTVPGVNFYAHFDADDIEYYGKTNYKYYTKPFNYAKGEIAKIGDVYQDCDKLEDYTQYTPNIISKKSSETKNFCFKTENPFVIMQPKTTLYIGYGNFGEIVECENILLFSGWENYFKIALDSIKTVDIQFLPKNEKFEKSSYYIISKNGKYSITSKYVVNNHQISVPDSERKLASSTLVDNVIILGKNKCKVETTSESGTIIKKFDDSGSMAFYGTIDPTSANDGTYTTKITVSVSDNDELSIPNFYFDTIYSDTIYSNNIYYDDVEEKQPRDYSRGELALLPKEFDECSELEYIDDYSTGYEKLEFDASKKSICIRTFYGFLLDKKGIEVYKYFVDIDDELKILDHYENALAFYGEKYKYSRYVYYNIKYPGQAEEGTTTVNMYLLPKDNYIDFQYYYIICNNFDGSIYSRFDPEADYQFHFSDFVVIPGSQGTNVQITKDANFADTNLYVFTSDNSKSTAIQSSSGYTHESAEVTSAFGTLQDGIYPDEITFTKINVKVTNQQNDEFPNKNFYLKRDEVLTYDDVTDIEPYDYSKGVRQSLPKEFEDCDEIEDINEISKTIEFTPTKSTHCFMSRGNLLVEGKGVTVYKAWIFDKEATKIENALAVRNSLGKDGKHTEYYFYKLSYTTKESEKITVHFPYYYGQQPYFILKSSFEGEIIPKAKNIYASIVIPGEQGRNIKLTIKNQGHFSFKCSDKTEDDESFIDKVLAEEGYTFPRKMNLVLRYSRRIMIKVSGKRVGAFPNAKFYLDSDLTYDSVKSEEDETEENNDNDNDNNTDGNNKLGGGAIAGIVIACIVVVAVVCALVWWLKFYNNTEEVKNNEENEKAEEGKNEEFYVDKSNTEV